jgi:hypothetical protein
MRQPHQNIYNSLITIILTYIILIIIFYITNDIHCNIYLKNIDNNL